MRARVRGNRDAIDEQHEHMGGLELAHIARVEGDGNVYVAWRGGAPRVACLAIPVEKQRLEQALRNGELAVLAFPQGSRTPLLLGLVTPPTAPAQPRPNPRPDLIEADVDGKRVRISAKDEIVFECGKASVTLRRNGKVIIRGTHVETNSEGTNRIKGGQVRIN